MVPAAASAAGPEEAGLPTLPAAGASDASDEISLELPVARQELPSLPGSGESTAPVPGPGESALPALPR